MATFLCRGLIKAYKGEKVKGRKGEKMAAPFKGEKVKG